MRLEPTNDLAAVRAILTHPRVYPWIGDDFSPQADEFEPFVHPCVHYVGAHDAGGLAGVFMLTFHSPVLVEVHISMLPRAWGPFSREAARAIAPWIFGHSPAVSRVVAAIPACNRLALRLARGAGFREYGVNPRAFQRGGRLYDFVLLGVSNEQLAS